MKKTDKKTKKIPPKKATAKKGDVKKSDVPAPLVNCSRTSAFTAYRSPDSAKRMITYSPLLLLIPIIVVSSTAKLYKMVIKFIEENILGFINPLIETLLEEKFEIFDFNVGIDAPSAYVILVGIIIIFMLYSLLCLLKKEVSKMREAEKVSYYFFNDIIAIYNDDKQEQFRTVNGIVSVKVTPAVSTKIIHVIMTVFTSLITFNSKPIWQMIHGFRDVIIVPIGSPSETIILHDVKDPYELVKNIKKHYPMCNVEGFGNNFILK